MTEEAEIQSHNPFFASPPPKKKSGMGTFSVFVFSRLLQCGDWEARQKQELRGHGKKASSSPLARFGKVGGVNHL